VADKIITARRRARAEQRLLRAATALGERFGVRLRPACGMSQKYPDTAAADLVERVADFLEGIQQEVNNDERDEQDRGRADEAEGPADARGVPGRLGEAVGGGERGEDAGHAGAGAARTADRADRAARRRG
jgi:hypothetical protein